MKRAGKRARRKGAALKSAPKRTSRKAAARKAAPKKRAGRKLAARKSAPKKRAGRKRAARKAAAKKRTRRKGTPRLRVLPRRPVRPPAFPQTADASSKQSVMFELMRARAALGAAIQGLTGGPAEEPLAEGKWSARQTILHIGQRERAALRALEGALHGVAPLWLAFTDEEKARTNRESLAALDQHDWESALRLLHTGRADLLEAVESAPDEPADVWSREHAFGRILREIIDHDRHHAEAIKQWRSRDRE